MHHMNKTIALSLALAAATSYKPEAVSLGVKAHKPYAVYRAARANDVTTLKAFISAGYAVEEKEGQQPWPAYAKEALELIEKKVDINAKDKYGETPLHAAVKAGNTAKVWAMLANGAQVNARNNDSGWTPLHGAACYGHKAVAALLIDNKADINAKDKDGSTPLHWAAQNGHEAVAALLLANGAQVHARNNNRKTPLGVLGDGWRCGISNSKKESMRVLLRKHGGVE